MSTVAKILVVVNLILAAAFVGSASTYLGNQDHWKSQYDKRVASLQKEIASEIQLKSQALSERTEAREAKAAAEKDLLATNEQNSLLKAESTHIKSSYDAKDTQLLAATKALQQSVNTVESYSSLITSLKDNNLQLEQKVAAIKADRDAVNANAQRLASQLSNETANSNALAARLNETREKLASTETALSGYQSRYGADIAGAPQPQHMGRILAARGGDNVYVISLGAEDGVKTGFRYTVSRGDQYVATIQIREVQSKQAAGFSVKDIEKSGIQQGDVVISN